MIDTKELRRLALDGDLAAMQEIIIRLEAADKERDALRINLDGHRALVFALRKEVEKLRAKIAEMEKQVPVAVVEMIERLENMEAALRDHHKNAMCEGCDHSHPLTQLRLSAYQQSCLYANTVAALEKMK